MSTPFVFCTQGKVVSKVSMNQDGRACLHIKDVRYSIALGGLSIEEMEDLAQVLFQAAQAARLAQS